MFDTRKSTKPPESEHTSSSEREEHTKGEEIKTLLQEMRSSLSNIDLKIDSQTQRMNDMKEFLDKQHTRFSTTEQRTSDMEDTLVQQAKVVKEMQCFHLKTKDLEARSEISNVRITGVPESITMGHTRDYIEKLLLTVFEAESFSKTFVIVWAHHSLAPRPQPGTPPRPIIAKYLNYSNTD
ncbi:hypothetical protein NDU88_001772 [Pleurodeles waltl]|uniref:t-SNARE coiled-coil homology domain-containing protein n=1 Tax=Pleurodeles waltl TaxID=8319 RepID=A0AAV7MVK3_PLEWA|nr:hypothetical protein NDU88_001772 [Pleurodeles waltl]